MMSPPEPGSWPRSDGSAPPDRPRDDAATASASSKHRRASEPRAASGAQALSGSRALSGARALLRLARPRQWTKNALLFAALLFARRLGDPAAVASAALGFVAFCLLSAGTYAINDLLDAERDRLHPRKRNRPIASGALSPRIALVAGLTFALAGLALCAVVTPGLLGAGLGYLALTQFYSLLGKNVPILDILLIAAGFVVRAVAGALAIGVPSSGWFLACTLFGALFLALCKRSAERRSLEDGAADHRPVLRAYTAPLLQSLISASLAATMISYALYVFDVRARSGRSFHPVELTLPCVVYGLFRYVWLVETRGLGGSPEEVLWRDRGIQLAGLLFVAIAVAALHLG